MHVLNHTLPVPSFWLNKSWKNLVFVVPLPTGTLGSNKNPCRLGSGKIAVPEEGIPENRMSGVLQDEGPH
jgi:hypothetical protein